LPEESASSSAVVMDYSAEWYSWATHTAQGGDTGTRDIVASWEVRSSRSVVIDRVTSPPRHRTRMGAKYYRIGYKTVD